MRGKSFGCMEIYGSCNSGEVYAYTCEKVFDHILKLTLIPNYKPF
jgi:hypothetical protein